MCFNGEVIASFVALNNSLVVPGVNFFLKKKKKMIISHTSILYPQPLTDSACAAKRPRAVDAALRSSPPLNSPQSERYKLIGLLSICLS